MNKYIIFDIDDTLVETFENSYAIFCEIAHFYNMLSINREEFLEQYMKWNFDNNIQHFFWWKDSLDNTKLLYNSIKKNLPKKKIINPQYFTKLLDWWYKIWILTNWPANKTVEKLNYLGITDLCSIIFHEWNMNHKKPNPEVFEDIYKAIGTKDIEIIYIWDALVDYSATKWNNIAFYAVLTWYTSKEEFLDLWLDESHVYSDVNYLLSNLLNEGNPNL